MDFIANQKVQIEEMLKIIGIEKVEELFEAIPKEILLSPPSEEDGMSEYEGILHMKELAKKNLAHKRENYLGGGAYEHHVPAIVNAICQKSEFLTSYTPYQAEASQGLLQIIFEFQSAICALTGMDVSNASLYDGASACAEALLMALRINREYRKVLVASSLHPHYKKVIQLYLNNLDIEIIEIPFDENNQLNVTYIEENISQCAGILVQSPNFFGVIENCESIFKIAKDSKAISILNSNPLSFGIYKNANELGADISIGDCQPLGMPLQFGGPYAGYIACKQEYVRQMPGRIVGETKDIDGKRGFVLTLQAREQHIRREKANSNICTNQALCALGFLITTLWYGPQGLKKLALTNFQRAMYLRSNLKNFPKININLQTDIFNEFSLTIDTDIFKLINYFHKYNIDPGIPLQNFYPNKINELLVCVTETKNKEQLDRYIEIMNEYFLSIK